MEDAMCDGFQKGYLLRKGFIPIIAWIINEEILLEEDDTIEEIDGRKENLEF